VVSKKYKKTILVLLSI